MTNIVVPKQTITGERQVDEGVVCGPFCDEMARLRSPTALGDY
jgi:hypothetical protein